MRPTAFLQVVEWLFFGYFILIYLVYALLNVFAVIRIRRYLQVAELTAADNVFSSLDLPVSVVVPAYNESDSIITATRAMLQVEYPDYEVIVVNDGSTDDTLQKLIDAFNMRPFPEAYRQRVPCKKVRGVYKSALYPTLRVVDKENGGSKADAMNAGIMCAGTRSSVPSMPIQSCNPTACAALSDRFLKSRIL